MPLRPLRSRGEERRGEERERGRERETKKIQLYKIQGVHPKVEHGVTQTAHTCQHGVERPRCCPLQKDSATGIARIYRVKRTPTLPKQSLQIPKYTLQTDSDSDLYNILYEMWPGIASPVQKPKPESSNLAVVCLPSIAIPLQDHLKQFSDRLMLHMFHAVRMT